MQILLDTLTPINTDVTQYFDYDTCYFTDFQNLVNFNQYINPTK